MAWQFASGEILTAANLNAVTLPWNALCAMRRSAVLDVTDNAATIINWTTTDLDPLDWHEGVTNPSRITPTIAGWYMAYATTSWEADNDWVRIVVNILKNGAAIAPNRGTTMGSLALSSAPGVEAFSGLVSMNGTTDYFELQVLQDNTSGDAREVDPTFFVQLQYPT